MSGRPHCCYIVTLVSTHMLCYPSHGLLEDSMKKVSSSSSLLGVVCSVILALAVCNIIVLVSIRQAPQLGALLDRKQQIDRIHSTPVFQMLQAARQKLTTDSATDADIKQHWPQQQQLQLQPQCQLTDRDLQGVLAAAAASTAASGSLLKLFARASALKLRSKLQQEWTAALQPFSAQPAQHAQDARNLPAGFHNDTNSSSASPARSSSSIASPARSSSASPAQGSNCKSVGLAPQSALAKTASSPPKTALLLVLGDWGSLQRMLSLYAINLYTIWCYARQHGYGLELYVHGEPLPHAMPVFFIKVSGVQYLFNTLGYQHVLYLDMDTFTSPHSAPPLSLFYGEFPAASLLLQAEDNLCAAAMLWRNTPDAALLLQAWWDLGAAGCCPTFPHDQTALKHLVLLYAANITGQPWVYPPDTQARFKLPPQHPAAGHAGAQTATHIQPASPAASAAAAAAVGSRTTPAAVKASVPLQQLSTDVNPLKASAQYKLRLRMQEAHSALGFVGVDLFGGSSDMHSYSRTVLHNCLGMWWGCVPFDTAALLYHTGHWAMEKLSEPWLAERLLHSVWDWTNTLKPLSEAR